VLFASRLTREKGVDVLLDAFALLPEVGALDIAGTGIAAGAVATRVAAHPRREAIRLLGHMDRAALRQRLAEASVVVVPSLWPEPYGIIGIEALAHGRPVVACDVGGIGEWAREELGVLKVPAGDAAALAAGLRRVVTEPLWRERAASAGAATVSRRHAPALTAQALAAALQP
jgi:glycosyltransferase involved in cell wall biosynthesis